MKKADWYKYQTVVENEVKSLSHEDDIDSLLENFSSVLTRAGEQAIGKHINNARHNSVPWWNDECVISIKLYKQALNKYKNDHTQENMIHFKKLRAKSRFIIKKSKKESWSKYVSTLTSSTPYGTK